MDYVGDNDMEIKTRDASLSGQPNKILGKDKYGLDLPKALDGALYIAKATFVFGKTSQSLSILFPEGRWVLVGLTIPKYPGVKDNIDYLIGDNIFPDGINVSVDNDYTSVGWSLFHCDDTDEYADNEFIFTNENTNNILELDAPNRGTGTPETGEVTLMFMRYDVVRQLGLPNKTS